MIFCTVSSNKNLKLAITLAKSIRNTNPGARIVLCLVEENTTRIEPYRWLFDEVVLAKQLGFRNFYRHIFRHNNWEAACSCKARLMLYAFRRFPSENKFVYVDADTRVYGRFMALSNTLDRHPVVLSPHRIISQKMLHFGYYNAGLIAFRRSPKANHFLRWWARKLDQLCYISTKKRLLADQTWLCAAARKFHAHTFTHPGYNVAPWNVAERKITKSKDGIWLVNGEPLRLFHYSGVLRSKNYFSRYVVFVPNRNNPLYELVNSYLTELNKEETDFSSLPWDYDFFNNGRRVKMRSRLIFRRNLRRFGQVINPFRRSNIFFISRARRKKQIGKRSSSVVKRRLHIKKRRKKWR